uniref:Photosystem I assembly protein Ycf3 n=1 Tax=Rheum lhasaense TaxID=284365 RepID=A0A8K1RCF7_9CARY|nr:photosystem I assembly protein Ycf3 [Persicaria jucunda]YP_010993312.1 photosystem I assembly protein Ycf3 [Persicaria tinctoria]UEK25706.1 photosystem I assembly protein Ycf3 [Rheum lhasaense]WGU49286.1 photosystem I assembly protein Ycf3 [Rheum rhabarbarum]WKN51985.1 photosystem I assembly protein Ycf3 [Persicaria capitata]WKN52067.1 photosystem I assembly protein Ycf3 [Persicaria nepalensis]WOV68414.1 photosystem I assembly protein Ycf3 [Rheum tanguticum var. liupanshanense]WOZ09495.1 
MPRSRINGNFIDKTFSVVANILLRIIPTTSGEKEAFTYYRGLIHTSNGDHTKALEYYFRALERNPFLPQAFNNMAVICHYRGEQAIRQGDSEIAEAWFDQAAEYWKQAIALTPGNYIEAHNWLKITRRFE